MAVKDRQAGRTAPGESQRIDRPLCVDLDGTLVATDVLWESVVRLLRTRPGFLFLLPVWACRGRAFLKGQVAQRVELEPATLPYRQDVLAFLRHEKQTGRRIYLATAADRRVAQPIADYLGLFDGMIASDGHRNRRAEAKVEAVRECIGDVDFDYIGNSRADLPVWRAATEALAVNPSRAVLNRLNGIRPPQRVFDDRGTRASGRDLLKALRPHNWSKNLLLAVPLAMSHQLGAWGLWWPLLVAFVAFGLCASATYIVNDIFDVETDRRHPLKRHRPFASGRVSVPLGLVTAAVLLPAGFLLAALVLPPQFVGLLGVYVVATLIYTMWLRRILLLDVIALAGLYTLRILAGGSAVDVVLSEWLLAFATFLFFSLALAKRYAELAMLAREGGDTASGRGYAVEDIQTVATAGISSGLLSVLVFSLYINESETATALYPSKEFLWLICPLLLYWVMRIWFIARRGQLREDPIVFTLKDPVSYVVGALGLIVVAASSL